MFQEIYVIDESEELTEELKKIFIKNENLKFKKISISEIELIFRNLPQLIIINDDNVKCGSIKVCEEIRKSEDNNIIPIIVLSSKEDRILCC